MKIKIAHFEHADIEKPMHFFMIVEIEGKSYPITYVPALDMAMGDIPTLPLCPFQLEIACSDPLFDQNEIENEVRSMFERIQIYSKG